MIKIDLHTHSTFSDGTLSPASLVKKARMKGITVLSLTDHDTIDGMGEFMKACRFCGIKCLTGVELSAEFPSTLHILGYRIDPDNAVLKGSLEQIRKYRNERNVKIHGKLEESGLEIGYEDIVAEAEGSVLARPHFARALVKKGYSRDIPSAFRDYLAKGAIAYVPRHRLSPSDCINLILEAGGLPVLAHPSQTTLDLSRLEDIVNELAGYGLWGIECIYSGYNSEQIFSYMKIAKKYSLRCTAGSDYHGQSRAGIQPGISVSEHFLPWARLGITL